MKLAILVQPLILSYAAAMSLSEPAPAPELEARYIGELCTVPVGVGLSLSQRTNPYRYSQSPLPILLIHLVATESPTTLRRRDRFEKLIPNTSLTRSLRVANSPPAPERARRRPGARKTTAPLFLITAPAPRTSSAACIRTATALAMAPAHLLARAVIRRCTLFRTFLALVSMYPSSFRLRVSIL